MIASLAGIFELDFTPDQAERHLAARLHRAGQARLKVADRGLITHAAGGNDARRTTVCGVEFHAASLGVLRPGVAAVSAPDAGK